MSSFVWDGQTVLESVRLTVHPRDRDRDGTADRSDAYPDNPKLQQANAVNDLRNSVPGVGITALAFAVAAGAAFAARRRS